MGASNILTISADTRVMPRAVWAQSLGTYTKAHAIPKDAGVWLHPNRDDRPVAVGWCDFPGLVDDEGLRWGARPDAYRCHLCTEAVIADGLCPACFESVEGDPHEHMCAPESV